MILSLPKFRLLATSILIFALAGPGPSDSAVAVQEKADKPPRSWPMFGGSPSRNMVNLVERGLVADWCALDGKLKNIRWMVEFGGKPSGSPVVADGKVFCATGMKNAGLLIAFRESDGKLLWQNTHETAEDWSREFRGTPSNPTVDGKSLFYVTPNCEVICAGADRGGILWRYDMIKELQVSPGGFCIYTPCFASPLVVDDLVFVATGNGRDDDDKLPSPRAPSFIALHKKTGKLAWQANLPGENVIQGQWSGPTYARAKDERQVIFAGGDSVIYSFAPLTGKLLWKCDCLPKRRQGDDRVNDLYFVGTPVVAGDRLYVGLGMTPESRRSMKESSYFLCLDVTKKGDVSLKSYDAKAVENKNSALVWAFGGRVDPPAKKGPRFRLGITVSTAAVHDGLVYIPEENGYFHCLDAATGQRLWVHDTQDAVRGSPCWVDGRVFLGTYDGSILIFAHGRTAKLLTTIEMVETFSTTPVAANGVIYVTTAGNLYAIGPP